MLGAAMAAKDAALPGLPPQDKDDVIDFGSSTRNEDHQSDLDPDDGYRAHTFSDGEEDGKLSNPFEPHEITLTSPGRRDGLGGRAISQRAGESS